MAIQSDLTSVTAVIIHWNSVNEVEAQLNQFTTDRFNSIVVVDNSQQITLAQIKKLNGNAKLISNSYNRGFSFAANQGADIAHTKWLFFLNPDVKINAQQIQELVKYAEESDLDAISPKPTSSNYLKPIPSLASILTEFTPLKQFFSLNYFPTKTLTGGCLLIKKSTLEEIGGWDERFFLWFEDSDLSKRLLDMHCTIGFAPVAVTHQGGLSFKNWNNQQQRDVFFHSMSVYAEKHFNFIGRILVLLITQRYTHNFLLPQLNPKIKSLIIPNIQVSLLTDFFKQNRNCWDKQTEVIVVTQEANRKSLTYLKQEYPELRIVYLNTIKGYAKTVNIGFRVATGALVATCNDDVILVKDWLEKLSAGLFKSWGSVNPIICNRDQTIESAGVEVELRGKAKPIVLVPDKTKLIPVDATNAACVSYNPEALNKIGLFDERFGSYLEDIDISLRLKRAGYINLVNPTITITHLKHQTSKDLLPHKALLDARNWWFVILKNWTISDYILNFFSIILERIRNISGVIKSIS